MQSMIIYIITYIAVFVYHQLVLEHVIFRKKQKSRKESTLKTKTRNKNHKTSNKNRSKEVFCDKFKYKL